MLNNKFKLRCQNKGIVVDFEQNIYKYDIVWKRIYNPKIFSEDKCNDKT